MRAIFWHPERDDERRVNCGWRQHIWHTAHVTCTADAAKRIRTLVADGYEFCGYLDGPTHAREFDGPYCDGALVEMPPQKYVLMDDANGRPTPVLRPEYA